MIKCEDGNVEIDGNGIDLQVELYAVIKNFNDMLVKKVGRKMAKNRMQVIFDSAMIADSENDNKYFNTNMNISCSIEK